MLLHHALNVCGESYAWNVNNHPNSLYCILIRCCFYTIRMSRRSHQIVGCPSVWLPAHIQCRALARSMLSYHFYYALVIIVIVWGGGVWVGGVWGGGVWGEECEGRNVRGGAWGGGAWGGGVWGGSRYLDSAFKCEQYIKPLVPAQPREGDAVVEISELLGSQSEGCVHLCHIAIIGYPLLRSCSLQW